MCTLLFLQLTTLLLCFHSNRCCQQYLYQLTSNSERNRVMLLVTSREIDIIHSHSSQELLREFMKWSVNVGFTVQTGGYNPDI